MNRNTALAALVVAAGVATAGGLAYAQPHPASGAVANAAVAEPAKARLTLEQAIAVAQQQHAGSRATKAELERKRGSTYYEVEVRTADNQVFDVKIDAIEGKVLSSKLDRHDHDDDDC
ncbi:MAG: PepSY domain-containing protein [Proteobacteria bacterium]|nr:PepSY domain-containing protein [Pseudomonadota bacterium]